MITCVSNMPKSAVRSKWSYKGGYRALHLSPWHLSRSSADGQPANCGGTKLSASDRIQRKELDEDAAGRCGRARRVTRLSHRLSRRRATTIRSERRGWPVRPRSGRYQPADYQPSLGDTRVKSPAYDNR